MKTKFIVILILFLFVFLPEAQAQCAMCRATIENNVSNGNTSIGAGLNKGILYLLAMPYLLISTLAYLWYRQSKKNLLLKQKMMSRLGIRL